MIVEETPEIQEPKPEPVSEVEEISLGEIAEPKPKAEQELAQPAEPAEPAPYQELAEPESGQALTEKESVSAVARLEDKPRQAVVEGQLDEEELKLIIRFLAMF